MSQPQASRLDSVISTNSFGKEECQDKHKKCQARQQAETQVYWGNGKRPLGVSEIMSLGHRVPLWAQSLKEAELIGRSLVA